MTKVWLGVFVSAAMAVMATRAEAQVVSPVRVPGFLPSTNGFQFDNAWPHVPDWTISVGPFNVPIGDASNGLCGGMTFAVKDYFESGFHVPLVSANPIDGTVLYNYITNRLLNSFTPGNISRLYGLQASPFDSDRQGTMVNEWPRIKQDIDQGHLSPVMLLRIRSDFDPFRLGMNHQVLVFGYEQQGNLVTMHLYDPDQPANDFVVINLNLGTQTAAENTGEAVMSFFREEYGSKVPPATQTWSNGFEGSSASSWAINGSAGTATNGFAATGAGYGWASAWTGVNSLTIWVPLSANHQCTMRAAIQTNPSGAINGHMNIAGWPTWTPLGEKRITVSQQPYVTYSRDFMALGSSWGLLDIGTTGTGGESWMRIDDAMVVCQTW